MWASVENVKNGQKADEAETERDHKGKKGSVQLKPFTFFFC